MKRRIVGVLALFTVVAVLQNGKAAGQGTVVGFKLGPNVSNLDTSLAHDDNGWLVGVSLGAFARFPISYFGVQPELLLVTKGSSLELPIGGHADVRLYYLELPVQLSFVHATRYLELYALLGPTFAVELSCSTEDAIVFRDAPLDCDSGLTATDRKKYDIGGAGTVGLTFKAFTGRMLVELRYTEGLLNLHDRTIEDESSVSNRTIALVGGYSVTVGRRRSNETCADCR